MKEETFWILLSRKIAGEASAADLRLLHELVSNNPGWKTTMENLQELWNSRPETPDTQESQQSKELAYLMHINRLNQIGEDFVVPNPAAGDVINIAESRSTYRRWLPYAAAVLVTGSIVWAYALLGGTTAESHTMPQKTRNEITISEGSRSKIQLPDGSQVWINAGSKLTYDNSFSGNTREVQLDGEAYFDVVKDARHPFIVHTSSIDIKVLGTAFNVKAYGKDPLIETTLIHGAVEVIKKDQPNAPKILLKPHEKLVYNKMAAQTIPGEPAASKQEAEAAATITIKPLSKNIPDSVIAETSWVYNKLTFEEERFEDLAVSMERWYNIKIIFDNENLKNYRISGSFVNETAEEALQELQFLVPFRYTAANKEIRISKK